jgi:hypothetical protein
LSTVIFAAAVFAAASETIFAAAFADASAMALAAASAMAFSAATHAASQTGTGGGELVVIAVDAVDATEVAAAFVAATVNVYAVDAVKPETVMGEVPPDAVTPPGDDVTV